MMISSDDVEKLLEAGPSAVLVLIEGRAEVIGSDELDTDEYLGAPEVISRVALLERTGGRLAFENISPEGHARARIVWPRSAAEGT